MQPLSVSKATTSMRSVTPWVRMFSTPSRRTTVWIDSVAVPCVPSPSTSSTILDKRSSLSPGRLSACLASSLVVYKRWVHAHFASLKLQCSRWFLFTVSIIVYAWCRLVLHVPLEHNPLWGHDYKSHSVLSQSPTQLEVQSPPGNTVGYVVQQWHPFSPKFLVGNEHSEPVLKIHGPFCGWSCLPDVDFEVGLSKHRNPLNWGKHNTEMLTFTSSGHFLVKDPPRALKQEICFQSELARMKPLQRARSCVAQCGYCSTAQLVLLNWGGKGIWVSDTDLLPDPEDG